MNTNDTTELKLTQADKFFVSIVIVLACFISGLGGFTGNIWVIAAGGLIAPISFMLRFPPRRQRHGSDKQ